MTATEDAPALPAFADVEAAAARIAGAAMRTPLLESILLNERLGGRVLIKAESLQHTGSFKFRGAYNRLAQLTVEEKRRGVVAYSSGNHAQAVAAAARMIGTPATIFMPSDAPAIKLANTRAYGADVRLFDRIRDNREEIGRRFSEEIGATLVKPYDEFAIIAGQGTAGLETVAQAKEKGATLDAVLIPCGGGGLTSGSSLAMSAISPRTEIVAVEPEGLDDTIRSLKEGHRVRNAPESRSICDGLLLPTPGELTFALNRQLVSSGIAVDDDAALRGVAVAFEYFKLVVEPSGAVGLGALLTGRYDCRGKTVAIVCTGGNVDPEIFERALRLSQ